MMPIAFDGIPDNSDDRQATIRNDRIAKIDALGTSLGPLQMTTDTVTAFDVTKCVNIGHDSTFIFHLPPSLALSFLRCR